MNIKYLNEEKILEKFGPQLENELGIKDKSKKKWISQYIHNHLLFESSFQFPQAGLLNTPGMGNVVAPAFGIGQSGFYNTSKTGSGDIFPSLLPIAVNIAARTIGFDLVSVVPMQGPAGILPYMEYVYAGGKDPYGSYPRPNSGNPGVNMPYQENPLVFKVPYGAWQTTISTKLTPGTLYAFSNAAISGVNQLPANSLYVLVKFIGYSRIDGDPIFEVVQTAAVGSSPLSNVIPTTQPKLRNFDAINGIGLSEIWNLGGPNSVYFFSSSTGIGSEGVISAANKPNFKPTLVTTLVDHIAGFTGSGPDNQGPMQGSFLNFENPLESMNRGTGEETYANAIALQMFTKSVEAKTEKITAQVTIEQLQDMSRQYGIDATSVLQSGLINEVIQKINKQIIQRLFALGWSNHIQSELTMGVNLNLQLDSSVSSTSNTKAYLKKDMTNASMTVPAWKNYGGFENQDTIHSRIVAKILAASNLIQVRGRRGKGTFVVLNAQLATALQKNAGYSFAPYPNTINQDGTSLYPVGTLLGMTVYVDPNIAWDETLVLVGRKGDDMEPGLKFMPYILAEKIQTIAEGTMTPKIMLVSRYALVDAGFYPETQYVTFFVSSGVSGGNALPAQVV
jgi:hypothetical protein